MTKLLDIAFQKAKETTPDQQENIANIVLELVKGDKVWDELLACDSSQQWLENQAQIIEDQIDEGKSLDLIGHHSQYERLIS